MNYGVEDGLRSAQCSPSYPDRRRRKPHRGRAAVVHHERAAWRCSIRNARQQPVLAPVVQLVEITARRRSGGSAANRRSSHPDAERVQIRYTGIHLSAPERVQYSYRLDGLDHDWVRPAARRVINYNSLAHGHYRFMVRAELPGGPASEASLRLRGAAAVLRDARGSGLLCVAVLLRRGMGGLPAAAAADPLAIRAGAGGARAAGARDSRHAGAGLRRHLVAARRGGNVHAGGGHPARKYLDMARRMARHSLTEARRSVMDLRASALEGQDLAAALESGTRHVDRGLGRRGGCGGERPGGVAAAGDGAASAADRAGGGDQCAEARGAQAGSGSRLHMEARKLYLRIKDNGRGFDQEGVFSSRGRPFRTDRDARARGASGRASCSWRASREKGRKWK